MEAYLTSPYSNEIYDITNTASTIKNAATLTSTILLIVMCAILVITILIIYTMALWKIFTKAGKPGWAAVVPVYNAVVYFQICGLNPWLLLLFLVPYLNVVAISIILSISYVNLTRAFKRDIYYMFGLMFFNILFLAIFAFGNDRYSREAMKI